MANQKVYTIQINGLTESISAVESLNKQLDNLDKRINALQSQNIKLNTSSGGKSALSEEEAIQREINKLKKEGETLDAKIVAAQDEIYKKVDATKQLYKETVADQKAMAAEERLIANTYSNTMQGMKAHLADLKASINVTDLGDTEKIQKMTQEAGELTKKLKEMEQAYGQFGRNVGNYSSAADGFKGLAIQVGDVTQKFDNAKQALKELKKERDTLATKKELGVISEEEEKRLKNLIPTVAQLQSAIQDAGKPMDNLMDAMQSLVAMAQVSKGFSAFFGFDDSEIQRSIQQLLALQNALQGLQAIQKQLQSGEGIGKIFKEGDAAIKSFTDKLFGVDKTAKAASVSVEAVGTAGKTAATGLGTASVAAKTTAKSFSIASAAATALRVVLNALGIGLVIGAISLFVSGVEKLIDKQKEAKKYQEDLNKAVNEGKKEYAKASLELSALEKKLNSFNGTKKQEKKLVDELNSKYGDSIGQYKSIKEWKEAIIKKAAAYAKALRTEAEAQAYLNMYTQQFIELEEAKQRQEKKDSSWIGWLERAVDTVAKGVSKINVRWGALATGMSAGLHLIFDDNIPQMEENLKKTKELYDQKIAELEKLQADNELGNYAPTIDKNGKKTKDAVAKLQNEINQLELRLMEDGLNKRLRQLDEEERQTINKLKGNSRKTNEEIKKIQRTYDALRLKEIQEYIKTLEEKIKESAATIKNIEFTINTSQIDNTIDLLNNLKDEMESLDMSENSLQPLTSRRDLKRKQKEEIAESGKSSIVIIDDKQLERSFKSKYDITNKFYDSLIKSLISYQKDVQALTKEGIKEQEKQEREAESERYSNQMSALTKTKNDVEAGLKAIEKKYGEITKEGAIVVEQTNKKISEETIQSYRDLEGKLQEINSQIETAKSQHKEKLKQITQAANNAIKKNEIDTAKEISATQEKYYNLQISNYREFISKLNDEVNENPVTDKNWGIVNINQTKKNYNEIINAATTALGTIKKEKEKVDKDPFITPEAKEATIKELEDIERSIRQGMAVTQNASKNLVADFVQSIQMYLQFAVENFNKIMDAVWDAQDNAFDKEQEQIDKDNEALEKALDKQQDIVQQHKDAIDDIEDELATSRGDRRQHLIDQLNAEIEAQRAAAAEEKRLEKEKEKQQAKQDELDRKRKKAQYHRDMLQAIVNGAMAVTYAAINAWPIPAIPMMALAGATTAAQLAIMASNKPYAKGGQLDGGVAVGNRHRDGGIKVLGGRAEIEGGEYVTNRLTTAKNLDLLEYVNSKKKRIDIADMLEFYNSGKPRKAIQNVRTKFEDGGYIAPLPTELDIKDQLRDIYIMQDNRPVWVSVVDINNKQADVRRVQTLAGLSE